MDVSLLPIAKVTVARLLADWNAESPMDVTPAGTIAVPVHALWRRTELSVIVIVPRIEHGTVVVAASATVPRTSNTIMQIRKSVNRR